MTSDPDTASEDWGLVDTYGQRYLLPKTMLFMGREECDIVVKSQSVDKRHAVITFDHYLNKFKIKDLSTVNGTYVNDTRIQDQEYVTLKHMDSVRLGSDSMVYYMEQIEQKSTISLEDDINIPPPPTMPAWATRELASLAECEGCIAEQKLCHTCGGERQDDVPVYEEDEVHVHTSHHRDKSKDSNTWPRKRVRNTQNITTFFEDSYDDSGLHRVLRGESSIPENLPPELETVKKGTPLYGQPDWWGEEEAYDKTSSPERPSQLPLQDNVVTNGSSTPSDIDNSKASSSSKDTLSHKTGEMNTPECQNKVPVSSDVTHPSEASSSMAFTVEFDDESPKMNITGKLEDFMPSKVRRSFRGRLEKHSSKSEDSHKEEKSSSRGTSPSRKSSSRGTSPARKSSSRGSSPIRQKKLDELWESSDKLRKNVRRNSSGASDYKEDQKSSLLKKDLNSHKRKLSSGGLTKAKSLKAKEIEPKHEPEVNESASYLIDKMFSSGTKSGATKSLKSPKSDRFTEHAMYREAKLYEFGKDNAKETSASTKHLSDQKKKPVDNAELNSNKLNHVEDSKKAEGDNVSESGTYTIEADSKSKEEEEEARGNISKAFGIDEDFLSHASTEPGIKNQKNEDLEVEDIEDQMEELERVRACGLEADSLDVEIGSDVLTELKIVEDRIKRKAKRPTFFKETTNDMKSTEPWMSQYTSLTNKSKSPTHSVTSPRSDDGKSNRKPPSGSRKRPGTGRKLPRLPNDKGSPSGSETSSRMSERSSKLSECTTSPRSTPYDSKKIVTISDKVVNRYDDTDTETVSKTKFETDTESNFTKIDSEGDKTPLSSRSSGASIDTDILLKDTAHVVAAVGGKHLSKAAPQQNGHDFSYMNGKTHLNGDYHDVESTVALINGDEEFEKPSDYGSPRENLAKSTKAKTKKPLTRVYSTSAAQRLQKFKENNYKRTLSTGDQSYVSDVLSESDTSANDLSLDLTTFDGNADISRKGSKGKGTISMTRPNRAFQLRRQRADGDVPTTPGSDVSDNTSITGVSKTPTRNARTPTTVSSRSSKTPTSSLRGIGSRTPTGVSSNSLTFSKSVASRQSWHGSSSKPDFSVSSSSKGRYSGLSSDRNYDTSARSEVSLGAQIVSKSQANARTNITRTDVGRYSLKVNKSLSTLDNSPADVRKSDLKSFKSKLKSTQSYGLSVTGVGSKTPSQPVSRSNSPKSAEKAAWKRRKEYDPRKAVAEAKTKVKDKVSTTSSLASMKRMTRSQSFTNSAELGGRYRKDKSGSISSTDNVSITSEGNDTFDDSSLASSHRGFIPYSGRSQSSHLYKTSDDEEISLVAKSSQSYDNILVSSIYQLSDKLKSKTNHVVHRLRDEDRLLLNSPSPIDDIIDQSMNSDMPAWKSANQELAGILSNLRKIEHHLRCLNRALFPGEVSPSESAMSGKEKQEYLQEIERIRSELAGFQPIVNKEDKWKIRRDDESVESDCEELGGAEEFF